MIGIICNDIGIERDENRARNSVSVTNQPWEMGGSAKKRRANRRRPTQDAFFISDLFCSLSLSSFSSASASNFNITLRRSASAVELRSFR
jgi:hypothetical protein